VIANATISAGFGETAPERRKPPNPAPFVIFLHRSISAGLPTSTCALTQAAIALLYRHAIKDDCIHPALRRQRR
jgi:hypothetical protein